VSSYVRDLLDVKVRNTGTLKRENWWAGRAIVGSRTIGVAGWNIPLHQPTGLGTAGELELGRLLRAKLKV
jgi:hypothetical protein